MKSQTGPVHNDIVNFLIDASHCVVSEAAYPNTSLEHRALYLAWRDALAAVGLTPQAARDLHDAKMQAGQGLTLTARGLAAPATL